MMNATFVSPSAEAFWVSASGVGRDAQFIRKILKEVNNDFRKTLTLGSAKKELRLKLIEIFQSCSDVNWDGYEAEPVSFKTYCQADQFLSALPTAIPCPEVSADPDGEIAFEWRYGLGKAVSVSIGPSGELTYAALFGSQRQSGAEVFDGQIPDAVLGSLQRLFSQ